MKRTPQIDWYWSELVSNYNELRPSSKIFLQLGLDEDYDTPYRQMLLPGTIGWCPNSDIFIRKLKKERCIFGKITRDARPAVVLRIVNKNRKIRGLLFLFEDGTKQTLVPMGLRNYPELKIALYPEGQIGITEVWDEVTDGIKRVVKNIGFDDTLVNVHCTIVRFLTNYQASYQAGDPGSTLFSNSSPYGISPSICG